MALMMPMVTVWPTPKGLPMASETSPMWIVSERPMVIAGRLLRSILSTARSVSGSLPITRARVSRPSLSATTIWSAPLVTWLLVSR
ncbi:hypothetical protein D3C76_1447010 [compost metagenome]